MRHQGWRWRAERVVERGNNEIELFKNVPEVKAEVQAKLALGKEDTASGSSQV